MVTVAEARNPVACVHFIKGFKSHPHIYQDLLEELNRSNISVVLITLPDPENRIGYMDDYESIAHDVCVEGAVDFLTTNTIGIPKILASHSTGGFLITKALMDEEQAAAISQRYAGTFFAAPFYGNKYHRHPMLRPVTHFISAAMGEVPVGTTWLERQFQMSPSDEHDDVKMLANHRQAIYMDGPTKDLVKQIKKEGFSDAAINMDHTFLLGNQDQVSYNALSKAVAHALSAKVCTFDGGHSMVRKSPEGRKALTSQVYITLQKLAAAEEMRHNMS